MNCISIPDEAFAVAIWGIELNFKFFDAFLRAIETKDTLDACSCQEY